MKSPRARCSRADGRGVGRRRRAGALLLLEELPPAAELAVDALEVLPHGRPRRPRVAGLEGREDGLVVAEGRGAQRGRLEVVLHAFPDVAAPAVPQILHDRDERAVVRGPRDPEVEVAVRALRVLPAVLPGLHLGDGGAHDVELLTLGGARGFGGDLALD